MYEFCNRSQWSNSLILRLPLASLAFLFTGFRSYLSDGIIRLHTLFLGSCPIWCPSEFCFGPPTLQSTSYTQPSFQSICKYSLWPLLCWRCFSLVLFALSSSIEFRGSWSWFLYVIKLSVTQSYYQSFQDPTDARHSSTTTEAVKLDHALLAVWFPQFTSLSSVHDLGQHFLSLLISLISPKLTFITYSHLHAIQCSVSMPIFLSMVHAFICSRFGYCNSLFIRYQNPAWLHFNL